MSERDPLTFVGTSDLAGLVRGKAFPASEWERRLIRGVGWTPTNVQLTCFDAIAETPFGALGDLALIPDPATRVRLADAEPPLDFSLGDIVTLEGEPWPFCTRGQLKRAIAALHEVAGATPIAAFEHEFQILDTHPRPGDAYGFHGFRVAQHWAEALLDALRQTPCAPDTFMKEYGPAQYEVTMGPAAGVTAADNAVLLRLLTHDVLRRFGVRPSFSPILDPASVGNGVHIHLSFVDDAGEPLTYDPEQPHGLSRLARHFAGGVLAHLDEILAFFAPSAVSYLRLTPHRWSAAFNNLGYRDREASLRICPVTANDTSTVARQFNIELRAADAAASPHIALAAFLFAGVQGIRDSIEPPAPTEEDLSLLEPEALAAKGLIRLPQSLGDALDRLDGSSTARSWFGDPFVDLYLAHKRGELAVLDGLDPLAQCDRYSRVY